MNVLRVPAVDMALTLEPCIIIMMDVVLAIYDSKAGCRREILAEF